MLLRALIVSLGYLWVNFSQLLIDYAGQVAE